VSNVEELLRPYVESSTIEEAERALDLSRTRTRRHRVS
jgi:hypothetical protein